MKRIALLLAACCATAAVFAEDATDSGKGSAVSAYMEAHLAELQSAVSQSLGKNAASVVNSALGDYFSESGTGKSASYTALNAAISTYISDPSAKESLLKSVADIKAGKEVKSGEVVNALLRGGLNTTIDNSSKLSANEKTIAKGVINELSGIDGSLQTASIEALQHSLVKNGMSEERAKAIGDNLSAYVSDTKNTTALKTAASIELQYVVEKNMGKKEAALVNAAISEYLEGNKGATKEAALNAVRDAVNKYMTDESAKSTLLSAVEATRAGEKVNVGEVGNALLRGGLNSAIDANKNLSANEKTIAKGVINQLAGIDGSLQTASIEALQHSLVKNGMSEERAKAIGDNLSAFVSDTKNTTALKTAASIELQYVVEKNMGKKEAALVNAAISEYLEGNKGATKEAALNAVQGAINKYVKDESAKQSLLNAVNDAKAGNPVNSTEVGKALVRAGVMEAIDQVPGLTAEQRDFAKKEASALLNKQTTVGDVAKDVVGKGVAAALEKAGVSKENASQIGQGVTDVLKDPSNTANLKQGGVNAAIDAIPGLTDEQRAKAKAAAAQVISGDKTIGEAVRDNAGYAVTEALKAAGVKEDRANEIGSAVDSYVKTGKTDALKQAAVNAAKDAVNAAIDSIPGLTPGQRDAAKKAAEGLLNGRSAADVAKEAVGSVVADALERAGVSKDAAKQIGQGVTDVLKDPSNTANLKQGAVNAAIDAIPGLTDEQRAKAKEAAAQVLSGDKTIGEAVRDNAGYAITEALKAAGVKEERANEIGSAVDSYLKTGKTEALQQAAVNAAKDAVNAAIDAIPGLTSAQKDAAKKAAEGLLNGRSAADVAKEAVGSVVADALERAGLSKESAKQIGEGITDVLKDPSNTDNLIKGGINAVIDAIPGLTDAQREAVRNKVAQILAGTTTVGEVLTEETRKAIADALEKVGLDPEKAKKIAGEVTDTIANLFQGNDVDWGKLGDDILDAANDVIFGEKGLLADWINKSDLPDEAKKLALGVIGELHGDEGALLAAGREALVDLLVEAGLTREQAEQIAGAAGTLAETWLNGGDIEAAINGLIEQAETIFCSKVGEMIDKQLAKLAEKYPFLKEIFERLGITGENIAQFLMKLRVEDIKAAFNALLNMTWEDWKRVLGNLYEAVKNWAIDKLCNYINGKIDEVLQKLLKKAMAALSKVKGLEDYMPLVQFGGTMVTDVVGTEAKGIINSSGATLKSLFEIKSDNKGDDKGK